MAVAQEVGMGGDRSQRIKLEQANEGFEDMKRGELARSVIVFDV